MKLNPGLRRRPWRVIRMASSAVRHAPRRIPAALELVMGLLVLIGIGTGLLLIPGAATRPLTFMEAIFTSTSASAVTGLSLFSVSTVMTLAGQVVLLVLAQIGGVSLIVTVSLIFYILGRQVTLSDRLAVTSSLGWIIPGKSYS